MSEEPIVIDTPAGIAHFQIARCIAALRIQANTGMTLSQGSMIAHCRKFYGTKGRTAKSVLKEMLVLYKDATGREYGS